MPVPFIAHSARISTFSYKFLHIVSFQKCESVTSDHPGSDVLDSAPGSSAQSVGGNGAPWRMKGGLG